MDMFLVNDNHCGDCGRIRGVFTSLDVAAEFMARQPSYGRGWCIERWVADDPVDTDGLPKVQVMDR